MSGSLFQVAITSTDKVFNSKQNTSSTARTELRLNQQTAFWSKLSACSHSEETEVLRDLVTSIKYSGCQLVSDREGRRGGRTLPRALSQRTRWHRCPEHPFLLREVVAVHSPGWILQSPESLDARAADGSLLPFQLGNLDLCSPIPSVQLYKAWNTWQTMSIKGQTYSFIEKMPVRYNSTSSSNGLQTSRWSLHSI